MTLFAIASVLPPKCHVYESVKEL